jgi:hypothetical protein
VAARTAWTAGNGAGYTWTTFFNSADLASLANGSAVMSSVTAIANQGSQDMFMDVSVSLAIASTTLTAGANFALYLYYLNQDGTTYGDNSFSAGTGSTHTVTATNLGVLSVGTFNFGLQTTTTLTGFLGGLQILPGTFVGVLANNLLPSTALSSGTQTVKYRTYNLNLNN